MDKKRAVRIGCVVVAGIGACGLRGCHVVTSDGDRVGVITKLARKGLTFKTWEGEAIIGSIEVPGVGTTWNFTVADDGPVDAVREAMLAGHKVRIRYTELLVGGAMLGDTDYRVVAVEAPQTK